jgi:hypothetical protein
VHRLGVAGFLLPTCSRKRAAWSSGSFSSENRSQSRARDVQLEALVTSGVASLRRASGETSAG